MTFLTKILVLFFICVSPSFACDTEAKTAASISGKGSIPVVRSTSGTIKRRLISIPMAVRPSPA